MTLTELSIKRPLLITTVFVGLILFGVIGYTNLNYNLLPSFSAGVITINTVLPGASPSEIQSRLTKPIEEAISTVEGIDMVTSSSLQNVSSIQVSLKPDVSDVLAQQDIERKINQIKSTLPESAEEPAVNRVNTDNFAILNLSATANIPDRDLYELIDKNIKPKLSGVKGVGQINIIGGQPREIKIALDNARLQMYGLSAKQVFQVVIANTISIPGGSITSENENLSLSIDATYSKIGLLSQLVVRDKGNGSRILLSDVATISDAQEKVTTLNRINGKPGIGVQIFKTNDANAVEVSKEVKLKLAELTATYKSQRFNYEIASDQSVYTLESANSVIHDLMLAVLIVGFVMLLFLHSLRSAVFVLIAIPAAMIPTFIVMYVMGFSLNLMTLLALSLVVGILVDDSIVVLENIFRHLEMGKEKGVAALEGRNEIGFTAVAITLVDVVVFLPMAMAGGLIGNILREFAAVVVVSTLMSLLVAFTLTPLMASRFARLEHLSTGNLWGKIILTFEGYLEKLKDSYGMMLHWVLYHKRYLFLAVAILMIGSIALVPTGFIGGSFAGSSDRGELAIQLETASDMPIRQTNLLVSQAEKLILRHPEVKTVYTLVGTQTGAKGGAENIAELSVTLIDKTKRNITSDDFGVIARNEIEKIPGIQVTVIPTSITGTVNAPIQVVMKGINKDSVYRAASIVKNIVAKTAGSDYVRFSTKGAVKQIQITPDREKIAMLGLSLPEVAQSIQLAFGGNAKTEFGSGDDTYNVNVAIRKTDQRDIGAIRNLSVGGGACKLVKLGQVARVEEIIGQSILQRTDRESSITITSGAVGRPSGTIVEDIQKSLQAVRLPAGTEISYQGDAKNQSNAFGSLGFALIIAIVLVYMIMVSLYESLVYPFVVIFSVPVALIGALLAIALTMNQLTVFTIIGMIMLLGLVTKNGILIVDFANHLKAEGKETVEALVLAGKERLRPIIMTTFAMILGMLPLALSQSPGSEFKNGMAWVLIGGLTSSFVLTLFLVPAVYLVVDAVKARMSKPQNKLLLTAVALLLTITGVTAQDFKLAGADYLYYPKARLKDGASSRQVSSQETNVYINVPKPLKNGKMIMVNGLQFGSVRVNSYSDIQSRKEAHDFYKIAYTFMLIYRLNEKWMLVGRLTPTLASDFDDKSNRDDFLMQGSLLANKKINENLLVGGGLVYSTRFGKPLLIPGFQLKFEQRRQLLFLFLPAVVDYSYQVTREEKLRVGFKAMLNGANFNSSVDNFSGTTAVDRLNYVAVNLGPTVRYRFAKMVQLEVSGGLNALRHYQFEDAGRTLHKYSSNSSGFLSAGLTIIPPKRKPLPQTQD